MPEKNDPGYTGVREYCANTREIVASPLISDVDLFNYVARPE
ncbi:hypothetical protein BN135_2897 [Cronobacter muytjensii 530]